MKRESIFNKSKKTLLIHDEDFDLLYLSHLFAMAKSDLILITIVI